MSRGASKSLVRDIIRIVAVVACFIALAFLLKLPEIRNILFDMGTVRKLLQGGDSLPDRLFSGTIFVLAAGGLVALGVPRLWASAVGGAIYGAFIGTLLSILASLIGASVLYYVGKYLLARVVERRTGERMKVWQKRFQENAFWWVLYIRVFPFSNSTLISLLCGSCRVPFAPFFKGSLLGFIPLAVAFAAFGSGGVKGNIYQIGFATATLIGFIFLRKLLGRMVSPAGGGEDHTAQE